MTLDEKLRAYAAKGELVHLSLAYTGGAFHCNFAAATPASGYSTGSSADPVEAVENAFRATPVRLPHARKPKVDKEAEAGAREEAHRADGMSLNTDWTTP